MAAEASGETRRDFLILLTGAISAVGVCSALWPFVDSMNPAADTLAAGAPIDVDLSSLQSGQQIVVVWRGRPIFIVHRTADVLNELRSPGLLGQLRDPNSQQMQQPTYAANWSRSVKPEYLVLVGICTHLGCVPEYQPTRDGALGPNWQGGYFCPCHGSKYDLAGRVFQGVPAPYNLPVPPYHYLSDKMIRIGENPPGVEFELSDVEQI
jgi:ubiquinol-cytochrome c reductase iron-sulfur subunit